MTDSFDLDAYLRRIGQDGPVAPDLGTLQALVRRHTATIAFENLDSFGGQAPRLDLDSLQRKLVQGRRGGYCYEQNLLLRAALVAIGFRTSIRLARVLWGQAEDHIGQRSHMLLQVDLADGPRIVDVGFGGQTLTGVLRLEPDLEQPTPHEPFRLVRLEDGFKLQALIGAEWKSLYRFDLQAQQPIDCEAPNWYVATHPDSHFVIGLSAARAAEGRRYTLRDADFAVHHLGGGTERRRLADVDELKAMLAGVFGLALPDRPGLDRALARLFAGALATPR
ncbi:N-hydroxyarylamine O-acetyltransferase [Inquilinus ginsengisoli]|uniref:N-hydroxyarylamine O-acetyltransferase n=1 Tax=Inquilinus ginsengisoli TaxID=363840 RepID=A0ABU1K085_9PROT|nr:arylamine N-acetyltransferase [Inquilinus ginsengisoli]MDR6294273.1 N-hydroxyarylamine O-acetyltransferase [Inquilinus ginsengisoli]